MFKFVVGLVLAVWFSHSISAESGLAASDLVASDVADALNDPTKPALSAPVQNSDPITGKTADAETPQEKPLKLYQIIHGKQGYTALINDKTVKVGDTVQQFTITKISAYAITLKDNSNQTLQQLSLFNQSSNTPTPAQKPSSTPAAATANSTPSLNSSRKAESANDTDKETATLSETATAPEAAILKTLDILLAPENLLPEKTLNSLQGSKP